MGTLNGWFKELYASQEINLVPDAAWLTKNVSFKKSEAGLGNVYHQPVVLTQEQGFTYAAPSSGAFALNQPIAAVLKDAQVQGAQLLLRSQIDYESLARAANTKGSFGEASKLLVKNMVDAISKRMELMFLYGRSAGGIGVLSAGGAAQATFTISAATWAPGLWAGLEGAKIQVLSITGSLPSLSTGVNRSGSAGTGATIQSVDFSTRIVTCAAVLSGTTAAADVVIFYGAWVDGTTGSANLTNGNTITFAEAMGLDGMISQQTSTLFNINIGTYGLARGNLVTGLTTLTVTNMLTTLLPAIGKGLMEDVVWLCSNDAFQGLVSPTIDPKAQAGSSNVKVGPNVTQSRSDTMRFGANKVEVVGYQGTITVIPHLFVKANDNFAFPKSSLMRVGATDVTFNTPGSKGGEFFLHRPDNAGYELRAYANQGLFSPTVGRLTKATL